MGVSSFSSNLATSVALVFGIIMAMGRVGESVPYGQAKRNTTQGLQVGFYNGRCPNKTLDIQAFIEAEVASHFRSDATVLPAFLRLQFHDCFVKGCDASILIEGTTTEKAASANNGVREYDFIDALKVKIEAKCPGIVSCADIIAIATKVVLKLAGQITLCKPGDEMEPRPSDINDVNLPSPSLDVPQSFVFFKAKNFTLDEMTTLLGCHTVGIAHCRHFRARLYNDSSDFDPNMDESLRQNLIQLCPQNRTVDNEVFLDQSGGIDKFDSSFYNQLALKRGLLSVDQALTNDPTTNATVNGFVANPASFNSKLALVMVKLQAVEVLTGDKGNIRKVCSKFN